MSSSSTNGGSDELSIVDKRMITKMLGDAAVPPQIINEVTANGPLSRQLLAIIDEAKVSPNPFPFPSTFPSSLLTSTEIGQTSRS